MIPAGTLSQKGEQVIYISVGTHDSINMRNLFLAINPHITGPTKARFVISGTALIRGTTSGPALITSSWPAGSEIRLDVLGGMIAGLGGDGGDGGVVPSTYNGYPEQLDALPGQNGGTAILVTYPISINNVGGIIGGGGGGGGGGGAVIIPDGVGGSGKWVAGSGGGGGAVYGQGGIEGGVAYPLFNTAGNNGSNAADTTTGGNGGPAVYDAINGYSGNGGAGGRGGDLGWDGAAGSPGAAGTNEIGAGGAGGLRGSSIVGGAMVTWITVGDLRGSFVL